MASWQVTAISGAVWDMAEWDRISQCVRAVNQRKCPLVIPRHQMFLSQGSMRGGPHAAYGWLVTQEIKEGFPGEVILD